MSIVDVEAIGLRLEAVSQWPAWPVAGERHDSGGVHHAWCRVANCGWSDGQDVC